MFANEIEQDVVDMTMIDKLRELQDKTGDPEFVHSVLQLYLEHTPPLVDRLTQALRLRNIDETLRLAHRIKGSSASIGAKLMASLCTKLEIINITSLSDQDLNQAIWRVRDIFTQTQQRLAALC